MKLIQVATKGGTAFVLPQYVTDEVQRNLEDLMSNHRYNTHHKRPWNIRPKKTKG